MKYVFILNPKAGSGKQMETIPQTVGTLPEKEQCEIYVTKGRRDGGQYVGEWLKNHPGEEVRFIACGGDGTFNEVCNAAVGHPEASVTLYPCGSGNDFVKSWGGAERFQDIAGLIRAEARPIDVMKAGDLYSVNVLNFGFDTTVAMTVNADRDRTGHGSKSSYTKGIVKALVTSMKNKCRVEADGELLNPKGVLLLCTLGNGQYVGGSFKCAPRAELDDGWIEVCLVKPVSHLRFIKLLPVYTEGRHLDDPSMQDVMVYRRAKKVHVSAPEGFAYSLDGEIIFDHDFTVELVPGALKVAVP